MGLRILITGAGGFIGRYLAGSFAEGDNYIIATYRNSKPNIVNSSSAKIKLVRLDLCENLQGLEPVDVVIHSAAAHPNSTPAPATLDYIQSNVIATLKLVNYCKLIQPKIFIHLSTISVHGQVMVDELDEDVPLHKPDIYGLTKYASELILKEHLSYFPSVCIRMPGVLGPGFFAPWLGTVLEKAGRNEPISLYNPDSLFNNVTDLAEIRRLISLIIDNGSVGFEVVNLAAAEPMRIREAIDIIICLMGSKSRVYEQDTDRNSFSIKIDKLMQFFGFEPATTRSIVYGYVSGNEPVMNRR